MEGLRLLLLVTVCFVASKVESRMFEKQAVEQIYVRASWFKRFSDKNMPVDTFEKMSFYTNATYKLALSCTVRFPCNAKAYFRTFAQGGKEILKFCSSEEKFEEMPKVESLEKMVVAFYTGKYKQTKYDCMISSIPTVTPTTTCKPTTTTTTPPVSKCQCGKAKSTINVGKPVSIDAVPWQVGLGFRRAKTFSLSCGGALIGANYVITAAHCVDKSGLSLQVFMGDVDLNSQSAVFVGVSNIQRHEQYNSPVAYNNDVALLTLDKSVAFTDAIYPACLPRGELSKETYVSKKMYVSGWATTEMGRPVYPDVLQAAPVEGKSNTDCKSSYADITDNMLCVSGAQKDACQGDSGGPLTYTQSSVGYLVGVASYGSGCSKPNTPEVFTRMTEYLDWIDSKTGTPLCSN